MKVLAILGSPRKGNSEILLRKAVELCKRQGHETELIRVSQLSISGCTECDACKISGECIIQDDMDTVYKLIKQSHRIIIASPIFFFNVPAQLKLLIDRCQCFWYEKYILKKPMPEHRKALVILVGGMQKQIGASCAEATLKAFLRTINVNEHKTLSYLGYDAAGSILENPHVMNDLNDAVAELLK